MKTKPFIEADTAFGQSSTLDGNEKAIEQFYLLDCRAENAQVGRRKSASMPHDSAQVLAIVPRQAIVDECPGGLARQPAPVSGKADNAEFFKGLPDAMGPEIVGQQHIIMDEHQDGRPFCSLINRLVVCNREPSAIRYGQPDLKLQVTIKRQRPSDCRRGKKIFLRRPCRYDKTYG